jgi:hypothetical protein
MSRISRLVAFILGLVLLLGVGGLLGVLGYAKYRTLYRVSTGQGFVSVPVHLEVGAEIFDAFKVPLIGSMVFGFVLVLLAIFRKGPSEPSPAVSAESIDPLAD